MCLPGGYQASPGRVPDLYLPGPGIWQGVARIGYDDKCTGTFVRPGL
jgi:hypothetical protein